MPSATAPCLAAIRYERGDDIDGVLEAIAGALIADGLELGGVLQCSTKARGRCATSVELVDLRTRARIDIWQELGECAEGCRLDERGLLAAAPLVQDAIDADVDLVILNRFGRAESRGGGLLPFLASALDRGIPVLTSVRAPYDVAWRDFHGGLAVDLPPSVEAALRRVSGFRAATLRASPATGSVIEAR